METALTVFRIASLVATCAGTVWIILLIPVNSLYCKLRSVEDPPDWFINITVVAFAITFLAFAVAVFCAFTVTDNTIIRGS